MPFWWKKGFIESLENANDELLDKYKQTFYSFLTKGTGDRVFNNFAIAIPEDFKSYRAIYNKALKEKSATLSHETVSNLHQWTKKIAERACSELLDGYGFLNWRFAQIIDCINYNESYRKKNIHFILLSYVFTVIEQAQVDTADLARRSILLNREFCIVLQKKLDEVIVEIFQKTQKSDKRKLPQILDAIYKDYLSSLDFIDKLLSDKDEFLGLIADGNNLDSVSVLSKAYEKWVTNEYEDIVDSRLLKFYLNRCLAIQEAAKEPKKQTQDVLSTTLVTQQLADSEQKVSVMPTSFESRTTLEKNGNNIEVKMAEAPQNSDIEPKLIAETRSESPVQSIVTDKSTPTREEEGVNSEDEPCDVPLTADSLIDTEPYQLPYLSESNERHIPRFARLRMWFADSVKDEPEQIEIPTLSRK